MANRWLQDSTPRTKYHEVLIIGNGPSAITLSFMLSGHWPYYTGDKPHPVPELHHRLMQSVTRGSSTSTATSLLEVDNLEELGRGLIGHRTASPISLLFDQLQHPTSGLTSSSGSTSGSSSCLEWRHEPTKAIDHVVIGCGGQPGGIWHTYRNRAYLQTVSRRDLMQLPGLDLVLEDEDDNDPKSNARVPFRAVSDYYRRYVSQMNLNDHFRNNTRVIRVDWDAEAQLYVVDTLAQPDSCPLRCLSTSLARSPIPRRYLTRHLVLATGQGNQPARLSIPGEDHNFVAHSVTRLDPILRNRVAASEDPILVVGSGLSAADALTQLSRCCGSKKAVRVVHIYRRSTGDRGLIFHQLVGGAENQYPEYQQVYSSMRQTSKTPLCLSCFGRCSAQHNRYQAYEQCILESISPDHQVTLRFLNPTSLKRRPECYKCHQPLDHVYQLRVSLVLVLIGSKPQLDYLPQDLLASLPVRPNVEIHPKRNPINIETGSYRCGSEKNLYAIGPLVGDHFVRFVQGGALAVASDLVRRKWRGWGRSQRTDQVDV